MSHTTTVSEIVISDVAALQSAVAELKERGLDIDLVEQTKPRAYSKNQPGMEHPAPYTIRVNTGRYDVGLYVNSNGSGYEARADFFGQDVERVLGVRSMGDGDQARLGKLYQMYAVHAATRQAMMKGYQVQRSEGENGAIQLNVMVQ